MCGTGRYFGEGHHKELVLSVLEGIPTHQDLDKRSAFRHLDNKKELQRALRVFLQLSPREILTRLEYGIRMATPRRITVDTSKGWHELIQRGGYAWVSSDYVNPKLAPIKRRKRPTDFEVTYFSFEADVAFSVAADIITGKGWQLADLAILATLGAEKRNLRNRRIIALGQRILPWTDHRCVEIRNVVYTPYLKMDDHGRGHALGANSLEREHIRRNDRILAFRH